MLKQLKTSSDNIVVKIARNVPRFSPNFITILGLVPPVLFLWLLLNHFYGWALVALIFTALDSVDGAYARATNQTSRFGAVLDASLDRASDAIIISAFAFARLTSWWLAASLIITSFLISYVKASAGANGQNDKELALGPIERAPRLILIFVALAVFAFFHFGGANNLVVLNAILFLLLILSVITFLRRLWVVR